MKYRSDVRDSLIRSLREKAETADYRRYLVEMTLHKLRAFQGARIRFRFPVTALIGPNSGGKSTVLGAAALIYRDAKPSEYFAVSSVDEVAMQGVKVSYRVVDREVRPDGDFERSVTHPKGKWSRDALNRRLLYFGVRRTIPANERPEYTKFRTGLKPLAEDDYAHLDPKVVEHASRIVGVDLSRYARSPGRKPLIGYAGGVKHSQFHFGAGISVIIDLVFNIEGLSPEDSALVLIEEIESSLHPYATRKLVEYLVGAADRKRAQVVFTTHSEFALDPLPREAIWACRNGALMNGRLRVQDVIAVRGEAETRLAVYCEDAVAAAWLQGMLRFAGMTDELALVEFYPVGGYADVLHHTKTHNDNPARRFTAIGFVDGNSPRELPLGEHVYRLPGTLMPEEVILDGVRDRYDINLAILTVAVGRRPEEQDMVRGLVEMEARATGDMHLVFSRIGQRLGFVPEETVRVAMIAAYCHSDPAQPEAVAGVVRKAISANGNGDGRAVRPV